MASRCGCTYTQSIYRCFTRLGRYGSISDQIACGCNRAHLGVAAHWVGEVTTPPIGAGDLLLLGSGSGRTASLINHAHTAATFGATVSLLTIDAGSPLGELADRTSGSVIVLPAPTPKLEDGGIGSGVKSVQPMGTLFEQTLGLTCDAMVLLLMEQSGQGTDEMFTRHANME